MTLVRRSISTDCSSRNLSAALLSAREAGSLTSEKHAEKGNHWMAQSAESQGAARRSSKEREKRPHHQVYGPFARAGVQKREYGQEEVDACQQRSPQQCSPEQDRARP